VKLQEVTKENAELKTRMQALEAQFETLMKFVTRKTEAVTLTDTSEHKTSIGLFGSTAATL
jgi:hypothetical protein